MCSVCRRCWEEEEELEERVLFSKGEEVLYYTQREERDSMEREG